MPTEKKPQRVHAEGEKGNSICGVGLNRAQWTPWPEKVTCPACLKKAASK